MSNTEPTKITTKTAEKSVTWDLVVIGGGPAGMMSAGRAAELGARVLILEKNESLGKKRLITGGGRCNVTNSEFDTRVLLSKFKDNDKVIYVFYTHVHIYFNPIFINFYLLLFFFHMDKIFESYKR